MIFPAGFTGFFPVKGSLRPSVDAAQFKAVCFQAVHDLGGRARGFVFPKETPNYLRADLEWGHGARRISVLCNRQYWIVGFCKPPEMCAHEYADCPELAEELKRVSNWQVLSKAELESVVSDEDVASMAATDRQVIEEARRKGSITPARTVGDLLYHFWD